jgi:nitrogen fixation NifU-like protein
MKQLNNLEYSKKVMKYFLHPKNMGEIKNPDAVGEVGNAICGDIMRIYLKIDKKTNKIKDIKFKTTGCAAAIATSSITTQLVKGKKLSDAKKLKNADVAKALGGLPPVKMHCSNLAADALHKAIESYEKK